MSKKKILIVGAIALIVIISIVIIITASGSKNTKKEKNVLYCSIEVRFDLLEYGSTYFSDSKFFVFKNNKITKINDIVIFEPEANSLNLYQYLKRTNNEKYNYNYSYDSSNNRIIGKFSILDNDDLFVSFFNSITKLDIHNIDKTSLSNLMQKKYYVCGWEYEQQEY